MPAQLACPCSPLACRRSTLRAEGDQPLWFPPPKPGHSAGPEKHPKCWGRASPPVPGRCHPATVHDETPPDYTVPQFKTPCSLCSVTWGLGPVSCCPHACTACQVGHEGSSAQPAARTPCPEQMGRKSKEGEPASCTTAHAGGTDLVSSTGTRHRHSSS